MSVAIVAAELPDWWSRSRGPICFASRRLDDGSVVVCGRSAAPDHVEHGGKMRHRSYAIRPGEPSPQDVHWADGEEAIRNDGVIVGAAE